MKPSIIVPAVLLLVSCANSDHGVKTARHAYSSSASGSNSFASSFAGGHGGSVKAGVDAGDFTNPAFWWAGPDSPFKEAYEYFRRCNLKGNCENIPGPFVGIPNIPIPNNLPQNGCNDNGCNIAGSFNINDQKPGAGDLGPIDISNNPFLNGEYQGIAVSSCSGNSCPGGKPHSTVITTACKGSDCKTNTQHGTSVGDLNLSQNPFLNGAFAGAGAFGGSGASGCAGVKGGCKGGALPAGGAGCNGAPGCTEGSSTHIFGYQGQIGGSSGCSGGSGCGLPGSAGGQVGGGSGSQGVPQLIGGCAGTQGGCKPGQTTGGYSGSTSFTGGSFSGSSSGNFGGAGQGQPGGSGSQGAPQLIGGCAGTLGGCKPGQTTGGYSGSTSSTGGNFGGTGQGQPGQNTPSTYPAQTTGYGSTSGSISGSGSTSGSFGGTGQGQPGSASHTGGQVGGGSGSQGAPQLIGGCAGTLGGCKPGQTTGGYSGSTSFTGGNFGGTGQGQPGQNTPSTYPGQTTGYGSTSGSISGSGSTSGSFSGTGQGQPGSASHTGGQVGGGSGSQGVPQLIGGCAGTLGGCKPGQTTGGYSGSTSFTGGSFSGSTGGSFGGAGQGQPGQNTPSSYPGQTTGFGSTSGSISGSGSTSGSFTGAGQGQPGYGQNIPTSQSGQTTGHVGGGSYSGSTTTRFTGGSQTGFTQSVPNTLPGQGVAPGQPGQSGYDGRPGQPGQDRPGQDRPGQPGYSGSTSQPSYTSGTFGTSGQPSYTSGTQHTQTASGSLSGSGSTSGSYNQPGYTSGSQHTPSGGYSGSTSGFGSTGSFSGSGSFGGRTTPAGGDHGPADGSIDGQLTIKCYGDGLLCVKKHLCDNGIINTDGEGLLHVRDGEHYCDVASETCCKLPNKSGRPYKDTPVDIPGFPGGSSTFQTTKTHKSSSSSSASSSASTNSFGSTTIFGSTSPVDSRFTPGPTAGGVQPGGVNPSYNLPGQTPVGGYQPGQSIPFGGQEGQSPGVIQVIPDGQSGSNTQAPSLTRPTFGGELQQFGPGQAPGLRTTPALQQFGPGQAPGLRTTPAPRFGSSVFDATPSGSDITNELTFASTLKGPAYLPPGPSPSPSPSSYSPDLLPPNRSPTPIPSRPSTYTPSIPPRVNYPTTPRPNTYSPSTPAPTNYYPTQKQTTPAYLPPFSGSQTTSRFVPTTRRPVTSGYLPPQVPSETSGSNQYLPPDPEKVPDSNIINISVIPPDRDPDGTNDRETVLRPTTPRPRFNTDFPFNSTPYPGCAAALKCVSGDFCTAEGVISKTRVLLTPEQENNRVPLTECQDPETGIIGKCCRDPEYKDPWPSTQLGLFNPDQDFQGSNPGVNRQSGNDGRYRPRPTPKQPQPGVKGGRPGGTRPFNPYEPNQIGSPSNIPNAVIRPGGYPTDLPNVPFDSRLVNVPQQVDTKPPVESRFDNKFPTSPVKNPETCGIRHPDSKPAGPGPIDASFGEIPWQAMILRDTNRSLLCGGAIIRRDVVLTAAHCVENLQAADVLVKGGEWKLGIDEEPKPFQINKVAAIVRHPGYRPENKFNDVALLILKDKFRLDRNVDTLCLPDPAEDVAQKYQNAKCITTGWGKTILQLNILNSIMHILGVGIIQGSQCQQQLQQNHANLAHLYNTNCVCGAPVQPQADICDVDVGSALACEGPDGRYTLAGIYSWDTGCNPTAQVAGYARIDTHWVQQTLQRPINDLKTEEAGFYQQLAGQECHCLPGKK